MLNFNSIVLVDDDEINNYLVYRLLRKIGFTGDITTIKNGEDALVFLQERTRSSDGFPLLVFMDIQLPVMNGIDVIQTIKQCTEGNECNIKFLPLSNVIHPDHLIKLQTMGIHNIIQKPLTSDKLHDHLALQ